MKGKHYTRMGETNLPALVLQLINLLISYFVVLQSSRSSLGVYLFTKPLWLWATRSFADAVSGVANMQQMEQLLPGLPKTTCTIRANPMSFLRGGVAVY